MKQYKQACSTYGCYESGEEIEKNVETQKASLYRFNLYDIVHHNALWTKPCHSYCSPATIVRNNISLMQYRVEIKYIPRIE